MNPFAFHRQCMIPLDGRGRLGAVSTARPARPTAPVDRLLDPRSIAVLGVSGVNLNFGRIILRNVLACGFPPERVVVVKPGTDALDGVRCVPDVASLPPTDLLVIASGADQLATVVEEVVDVGDHVRSAILIPGGVGEREGTQGTVALVRAAIARGRTRGDGGPVFLGPNSLGAVSRPGSYDTFFIPAEKLDKRWTTPARPVALVSQSGAFIVSRLSNLETLDPAFAISIGNQLDLTVSDVVAAVGPRDDVPADAVDQAAGPPAVVLHRHRVLGSPGRAETHAVEAGGAHRVVGVDPEFVDGELHGPGDPRAPPCFHQRLGSELRGEGDGRSAARAQHDPGSEAREREGDEPPSGELWRR